MRKLLIYLLLSTFVNLVGFAQSTIIMPGGTTESIKTSGANNGMVFSGLTTQERDAIANPKVGQLIYNKTKGCFEFYNGFRWHNLCENDYLNNSLNNGLVAYYPFNGNANDVGGNNLNGAVNGAVLTTDRFGNPNKAYSFNTNQDITIPNSSSLNTFPITISLWYMVNTPSGLGGGGSNIFSKYIPAAWNGFSILSAQNYDNIVGESIVPWYIKDTDNRVIGSYGDPLFLQSNVEFNKWYHFG
jgi:hypothetical protein